MSGDLISREAVLKALRARVVEKNGMMYLPSERAIILGAVCEYIVENIPAVDAEPVRHGKWYKPMGMMPPEHHGRHRCDRCKHLAPCNPYGREKLTDFCPNCGAKMDKEAEK